MCIKPAKYFLNDTLNIGRESDRVVKRGVNKKQLAFWRQQFYHHFQSLESMSFELHDNEAPADM